jgi:hypothetical protein
MSATKQTCGPNFNASSEALSSPIILILWSIPLDTRLSRPTIKGWVIPLDSGGQPQSRHGWSWWWPAPGSPGPQWRAPPAPPGQIGPAWTVFKFWLKSLEINQSNHQLRFQSLTNYYLRFHSCPTWYQWECCTVTETNLNGGKNCFYCEERDTNPRVVFLHVIAHMWQSNRYYLPQLYHY